LDPLLLAPDLREPPRLIAPGIVRHRIGFRGKQRGVNFSGLRSTVFPGESTGGRFIEELACARSRDYPGTTAGSSTASRRGPRLEPLARRRTPAHGLDPDGAHIGP